jgi:hypothetical protein
MAQKAEIQVQDTGEKIKVMFNPTEYTVSEKAEVIFNNARQWEFQKFYRDDFMVTLFYDTYEKQTDVRDEIKKISDLLRPTKEGTAGKRPQICVFTWGNFTYKGIVSKVDQKFILFLDTGIPVRADVTVTFKYVENKEEFNEHNKTKKCRKLWTVRTGDRLDMIAQKTLFNVGKWRMIAEENKIDNPLLFPSPEDIGRQLVIPDI